MKKLRVNFGAKLTAVVLVIIFLSLMLLSVFGIAYMVNNNYYYDGGKSALEAVYKEIGDKYARQVMFDYYPLTLINDGGKENVQAEKYENRFSSEKTNFSFVLSDEQSNLLLENFAVDNFSYSGSYSDRVLLNSGESLNLTIDYQIAEKPTAIDDFYNAYFINESISQIRYAIIFILIISLVIIAVLLVFLIYSIGCREANGGKIEISRNFSDKIPLDIYLVCCGIICIISHLCVPVFSNTISSTFITGYIVTLIWCLMIFSFTMTLSVRCKCENPLKNTMLFRFFKWLAAHNSSFRYFINGIPIVWKGVILLSFLAVVEFAFIFIGNKGDYALFWLIEKLIVTPLLLVVVINFRQLKSSIKKIAESDIDLKVDDEHLIGEFKDCAKDLNSINESMQKIVDERMKSERFKTELITNVSHDIKTPLTSIVTYIDLLKKENISSSSAKEYVKVLDKQSNKLMRLINDLVDASKISSGSMNADMTINDVGVLLTQAVAEYDDKFAKAEITPVVETPKEPLMIMADGRLLWRVFDNLLSNICKYSLKNTRAYVSAFEKNDKAVVVLRNISKCELNISSDELMERFVRGDSSRNIDGSGLGLSIAQSLVSLQNGEIETIIDGDLFKVQITFDIAKNI